MNRSNKPIELPTSKTTEVMDEDHTTTFRTPGWSRCKMAMAATTFPWHKEMGKTRGGVIYVEYNLSIYIYAILYAQYNNIYIYF